MPGCETHTNNWRREGIPPHCNLPRPTMAMFLYVLFSVLSAYNTNGAPVAFDLAAREDPLSPDSCKSQLKRTLFGIVWSCVSTTILCAWTAVHPNIPPRSKWKARWNRLMLMFWMIVAPELVLAWAVRQFFAAKDIRDSYNESHPGEYHRVASSQRADTPPG